MIVSDSTVSQALRLWNYLSAGNSCFPADAVLVCCSYDLRVCDHACRLMNEGYAEQLLFSGDRGNWTRDLWEKPEALIYRERALARGIRSEKILTEERAGNLGENIRFSREMLPEARRVILVSKPNTLLRLRLTCEAQWPEIEFRCSAPELRFPGEVSETIGLEGVIHEMVGDIQRIQDYPSRGYQASHKLPRDILEAWGKLIAAGFDQHMFNYERVN